MISFKDYYTKFPDLIIDLLEYFDIGNGNLKEKSVIKFCLEKYSKSNVSQHWTIVQPQVVSRICDILCNKNIMETIKADSPSGINDNYLCAIKDEVKWVQFRDQNRILFNSIVYGFEYIYYLYKSIVVPIELKYVDGKSSLGTVFSIYDGIATAKHCLENAKIASIKGYKGDELKGKKIFVSSNPKIDLAFINLEKETKINPFPEDGAILQEVMAMGYPKISGFDNFLTAEKAMISAVADFRFTTTRGEIAAVEKSYLNGLDMILITAKIIGGNSGSPVINQNGSIIGIATNTPLSDGTTDELGYGIVTPIHYLYDIIKNQFELQNVPCFTDFHG